MALGLTLPPTFPGAVTRYLDELERWQRVGGLTAYRTRLARLQHLVLESLMWLTVLPAPAAPLLDVGSGAGVPGLVLKLARPEWEVELLDATRRRANFLRHMVRELGLGGVAVHWGRAEALAGGPLAGRFQTVTMRAVAPGASAAALAAPFLAPAGHLVVSVGPTGTGPGTRREVVLDLPGELSWRRRFLIIRGTAREADVPRGTGRTAEP